MAPFKAQNMSLNSVVTRDGAEIGRAQAMQAAAAGIEPEAALNPVLLKPGARGTSQVMVLGKPVAEADAMSYPALKPRLADTVLACLTGLADRFDVVVCEGAGSPAEINLREHDLANMGLARAAGLPVIVVADIDRGGALAALYGTLALLSRDDQALVAGFVVNKFRGDARLLQPGLDRLRDLTGRPVLGVLPWTAGLWLDAEDSLGLGAGPDEAACQPARAGGRAPGRGGPAAPDQQLHRHRPAGRRAGRGGPVRHLARRDRRRRPGDPARQPGHRGRPGLAARARAGRRASPTGPRGAARCSASAAATRCSPPRSATTWRAAPAWSRGLACCRPRSRSAPRRCSGSARRPADGEPVTGYEIHHGVVTADGGEPFPGGCSAGAVLGHHVARHLRERRVPPGAAAPGRRGGRAVVRARSRHVRQLRERKLDTLADLVDAHMDTAALQDLIDHGAPAGLPFIPPGTP